VGVFAIEFCLCRCCGGGCAGGLVSGWIMRYMAEVMGMRGCQWMFAIEGAPALVLAVVAAF